MKYDALKHIRRALQTPDLTNELIDTLLLYMYEQQEYPASKIGQILDVDKNTVLGHLRALGAKLRPRGGANNKP